MKPYSISCQRVVATVKVVSAQEVKEVKNGLRKQDYIVGDATGCCNSDIVGQRHWSTQDWSFLQALWNDGERVWWKKKWWWNNKHSWYWGCHGRRVCSGCWVLHGRCSHRCSVPWHIQQLLHLQKQFQVMSAIHWSNAIRRRWNRAVTLHCSPSPRPCQLTYIPSAQAWSL